MISRFSLYDFIAVVIPGIFFMWALGKFAGVEALLGALPLSGGIAETSVLIVVGYVVGLLLQGVSQQITERVLLWWWGGFPSARWLLPDDGRFTKQYKEELSRGLRAKFGIEVESKAAVPISRKDTLKRNQEIFYRCYRAVEKVTDLPQAFVAQYGLFRALLTTFGLLVVVSAWGVLSKYSEGRVLDLNGTSFVAVCVVGAMISYWRVTKRGEDFARAVYDVFLANAGTGRGETKRSMLSASLM